MEPTVVHHPSPRGAAARRLTLTLCFALVLVSAQACAGLGAAPRYGPVAKSSPVSVKITNKNWSQVVVHVLIAGSPFRLGEVGVGQTRTFALGDLTSPLGVRFRIRPLGSSAPYLTREVVPQPGNSMTLTVENNLQMSNIEVR